MRHFFVFTFLSLVLIASTGQAEHLKILDDFYITFDENPPVEPEARQDCRSHIRQIMCLANALDSSGRATCQEGGAAYARHFEALYDRFPAVIQKMFCSLRVIYVLKKFQGTAFAGLLRNRAGRVNGAQMGIRQSVLDEQLDLETWASWKEELSFGGIKDSYTLTADLPHVVAKTRVQANDFLFFTVAHEFGHIFDFANNLNRTTHCDDDADPECTFASNSWGTLSWITTKKPRPENDYTYRAGLCFYDCGNHPLSKSVVPDLYEWLYTQSTFLSTYAATDAWQEFADSLAYYLCKRSLGETFILDTMQGDRYDIMAKIHSPLYAPHRRFLETFLNRRSIVYP